MQIPIFDEILLNFLSCTNPYLPTFFTINPNLIYLYVIFAMTYFIYKRDMRNFLLYLANFIIALFTVTALKEIINRPRPNTMFRTDPSFPSRHSFTSMFTLNFLYPHITGVKRYVLVVYSLLIPLSRLYLGLHYPSDIMIGGLLGLLFPRLVPEKYAFMILNSFQKFFSVNKRLVKKIKH